MTQIIQQNQIDQLIELNYKDYSQFKFQQLINQYALKKYLCYTTVGPLSRSFKKLTNEQIQRQQPLKLQQLKQFSLSLDHYSILRQYLTPDQIQLANVTIYGHQLLLIAKDHNQTLQVKKGIFSFISFFYIISFLYLVLIPGTYGQSFQYTAIVVLSLIYTLTLIIHAISIFKPKFQVNLLSLVAKNLISLCILFIILIVQDPIKSLNNLKLYYTKNLTIFSVFCLVICGKNAYDNKPKIIKKSIKDLKNLIKIMKDMKQWQFEYQQISCIKSENLQRLKKYKNITINYQ